MERLSLNLSYRQGFRPGHVRQFAAGVPLSIGKGAAAPKVGHPGGASLPGAAAPLVPVGTHRRSRPSIDWEGAAAPKVGHPGGASLPGAAAPLAPVGTHAPLRYGCAPSTKHSSGPIHKALSRWFCRRRPSIDWEGAAAPKVGHPGGASPPTDHAGASFRSGGDASPQASLN